MTDVNLRVALLEKFLNSLPDLHTSTIVSVICGHGLEQFLSKNKNKKSSTNED